MRENQEYLKSLGKRIDELRRKQGISFQELADRCDMEKSSLVKLATKGKNVTVNTLCKISVGLGVSLKELFDFDIPGKSKV